MRLEQDNYWQDAAEFLGAVVRVAEGGASDPRLWAGPTGLGMSDGGGGGFLVPPSFGTGIWEGVARESLFERLDTYPVEGESLTLLAPQDASNVEGALYGGVRGYFVAEADEITSSAPGVRQVKLSPHPLIVMIPVTDKLLSSGEAVAQYVQRAAGAAIAAKLDKAVIRGTGVGQPKGLLASGSTITVEKETGQLAGTIVFENISKMTARLVPASFTRACWLMHPSCLEQILRLNSGVGAAPLLGTSADGSLTLATRPVLVIDSCSTLGTVGDLILTDLSAYLLGYQSGGLMTAISAHVRFDYLESKFRFVLPLAGQPWLESAITPENATDTLSTTVTLATRA